MLTNDEFKVYSRMVHVINEKNDGYSRLHSGKVLDGEDIDGEEMN